MAPLPTRGRFHPLAVSDVRPLTDDAIEVTFAVPPELVDDYRYLPGQNVALRATIDGREVRRSYSLCRAPRLPAPPPPGAGAPSGASGRVGPGSDELSVAIKRDPGGRFSTWAHTELRPGVVIDVMSPQGTFTTRLPELDGTHIAGIAAGSGITPLMAVATSVLEASATSRFTLVYTNRSQSDVMFADELADLKDRFPARLTLHHVLSREQRAASVLSGRIDEPKLRTILERLLPPTSVDEWFLCGPLELVQMCRGVLEDSGVDPGHIRFELFTTGEERDEPTRPVEVRADEPTYALDFTLDGQSSHVESPLVARESLLTAALRVRPDAPYSCSGGVCGTCRARLLHGSVTMTENYALEPDELERGYVLTCQSHPTSETVVVDYDS